MTKLDIAKKATSLVVGVGASKIVADIILNNVNPTTIVTKITVAVAAVVIGAMASDATKKYTDAKIDEFLDAYKQLAIKN